RYSHPMVFCSHINPSGIAMHLLERRCVRLPGATLPVLTIPWTTCCPCHRGLLPPHEPLRHRVRGENARHASTREPTPWACVTTAAVASPVTMLANGYKTPRFSRPLTPRCLSLYSTPKGGETTSYFPLSAITDRLDARNQFIQQALQE